MNVDDRHRRRPGSPLDASADSPPPGVEVTVDIGAASRCSERRVVNDDHYLVLSLGRSQETLLTSLPPQDAPPPFEERGYAMFVADGVGGADGASGTASRLALITFAQLANRFGRWNVRIDDNVAREVMARGERFYRAVDSTLRHTAANEATRLQSTLTVAYSAGRDLFLAHVGHSRAYLLRRRQLMQLTHDHTRAALGSRAPLVDISAAVRDLHHVVTDTLGGAAPDGPRIDIDRFPLLDGDVLLLCTNGLSDMVTVARMTAMLCSTQTSAEQCGALVAAAIAAGGPDDVTAVVVHYGIPEPGDSDGR